MFVCKLRTPSCANYEHFHVYLAYQRQTGTVVTRQTYDRAPCLTGPPTAHISRGDIGMYIYSANSGRVRPGIWNPHYGHEYVTNIPLAIWYFLLTMTKLYALLYIKRTDFCTTLIMLLPAADQKHYIRQKMGNILLPSYIPGHNL